MVWCIDGVLGLIVALIMNSRAAGIDPSIVSLTASLIAFASLTLPVVLLNWQHSALSRLVSELRARPRSAYARLYGSGQP